jgi:hypothetical protein
MADGAHPSGLGAAVDLAASFVHLAADGSAHPVTGSGRAHPNLAGVVIGAPIMTQDAPHGGESHPDGDELLNVISGHLQVSLDQATEVREGCRSSFPRRPGIASTSPSRPISSTSPLDPTAGPDPAQE